ncbi:cytochrome c1 [Ectothiorhodospiraceae bacterium 2226]|nr:cytochrome c1 [Ectothiorhodospiraceae bacterium 2226]
MKKFVIALILAVLPGWAAAAGPAVPLDRANVNLEDTASLQRGARLFVNYCLSCHSANYMRYNRMGEDLALTESQVTENLMFTTERIGDTMSVAMPRAEAAEWFGKAPPDLSVIARARGADWLYTFLRTFYVDEDRPFGVNNAAFPDVGMPHVLWELEGLKAPVYRTETDANGDEAQVLEGYQMARRGSLTPAEYDVAVNDLVNFMVYMGEPMALDRQRLGLWVLLFLAIFTVLAYALKKEYWKDVH